MLNIIASFSKNKNPPDHFKVKRGGGVQLYGKSEREANIPALGGDSTQSPTPPLIMVGISKASLQKMFVCPSGCTGLIPFGSVEVTEAVIGVKESFPRMIPTREIHFSSLEELRSPEPLPGA